MLKHTSHKLVLKDLDDFVEDAGRNGDVLVDPQDVLDNRYLDG